MAISIDEELTIHNRLLDDLDEDVTVTHSRMRAAQKRVAAILRDSGGCRFSCAAFGVAVVLVVSPFACAAACPATSCTVPRQLHGQ